MHILIAAVIGLVFGTGIIISGMGNPAKVLAFFDVAGKWDPSLAFVMGGALVITAIGYRFIFARGKPLLADAFSLPTATQIDAPLLAGSALFGVGWGITGFCPGAVIPMLGTGRTEPAVFAIGMVLGMVAARSYRAWAAERSAPAQIGRST